MQAAIGAEGAAKDAKIAVEEELRDLQIRFRKAEMEQQKKNAKLKECEKATDEL